MKTNTSRRSGFTLVEILIVTAIIGLLAALAIPNAIRARQRSQTTLCINNLRQIDAAKQQWALENAKSSAATPTFANLQVYLGRGEGGSLEKVYCPISPTHNGGDGYEINAVGEAPTCINVDPLTHNAVFSTSTP